MEMTGKTFLAQERKNTAGNYSSKRLVKTILQDAFNEALEHCIESQSAYGSDIHANYLSSLAMIGTNLMTTRSRFFVKGVLNEAFSDAMKGMAASQQLNNPKAHAAYLEALGVIGEVLIKSHGVRAIMKRMH